MFPDTRPIVGDFFFVSSLEEGTRNWETIPRWLTKVICAMENELFMLVSP